MRKKLEGLQDAACNADDSSNSIDEDNQNLNQADDLPKNEEQKMGKMSGSKNVNLDSNYEEKQHGQCERDRLSKEVIILTLKIKFKKQARLRFRFHNQIHSTLTNKINTNFLIFDKSSGIKYYS